MEKVMAAKSTQLLRIIINAAGLGQVHGLRLADSALVQEDRHIFVRDLGFLG